ncbi:MAG: hypothetical protein NC548_27685 [Lachnospiraceae bacterium]|nr:hypothetical protein [Clostridium sp.]MCM1218285.1 hypothetical protein [Lachnospiraceae bacterium]
MLTITTNKAEIRRIADRSIRERTLPITDFWTKRIVNLLGAADSDRKEIMHNLAEDRAGTTDAEREVTFTAGGAAAVRVKVTIRIGQQSGIDCFILTIRDVLEVRGAENIEPEPEPEVVGMPNAPAVRVISKQIGFCKYCGQSRIIEAPEGFSAADLNEQASEECDCDEARRQRERRAKMEAAGAWAQNMFSKENGQLQVVLCAIRSTFEGAIDYVTVKIGKRTHKIDTDSDGMIRIRSTFRDSNEETF